MTPNTQTLQRLLDAVEAGETPNDDLIIAALGHRRISGGWYVPRLVKWIMDPADIRAMGAAKSLHDALVPGWDLLITTYEDGLFEVSVSEPLSVKTYDGLSEIIARAWLLALIRAVMAGER